MFVAAVINTSRGFAAPTPLIIDLLAISYTTKRLSQVATGKECVTVYFLFLRDRRALHLVLKVKLRAALAKQGSMCPGRRGDAGGVAAGRHAVAEDCR